MPVSTEQLHPFKKPPPPHLVPPNIYQLLALCLCAMGAAQSTADYFYTYSDASCNLRSSGTWPHPYQCTPHRSGLLATYFLSLPNGTPSNFRIKHQLVYQEQNAVDPLACSQDLSFVSGSLGVYSYGTTAT
ncbi:hypothetical protein FE257_006408 [Aspergillus nanangensis]|uniref:Uncharacterized protein n=1 Tax=Aspergillus nanangensis TaxID=2582783 RepID=A0AAD4H0B1_ASPNN|nr:hypothetical protein FE257_006408 [Aspergillus nanangensis]